MAGSSPTGLNKPSSTVVEVRMDSPTPAAGYSNSFLSRYTQGQWGVKQESKHQQRDRIIQIVDCLVLDSSSHRE